MTQSEDASGLAVDCVTLFYKSKLRCFHLRVWLLFHKAPTKVETVDVAALHLDASVLKLGHVRTFQFKFALFYANETHCQKRQIHKHQC